MTRKLPPDEAFQFYVGLGSTRSYRAVAEKFGVSKRTVTHLATKRRWREQLEGLQQQARKVASEKALESLGQMNDRHLKSLRVIQSRALEALRGMPLDTALGAVRALDISIRHERSIRGDAGDGGSIEEVIRREYARWMETPEETEDDDTDERLPPAKDDEPSTPVQQTEVLP